MKTIPTAMQQDLDAGATHHCHCWLVERVDGVNMGFTDHDQPLTFGVPSVTYEAEAGMTASSVERNAGLSVDNMTATGALKSDRIREDDIAAGIYDNAGITVYRVDWLNTDNRIIIMSGILGEVKRSYLNFAAEIRSRAAILNEPHGRFLMMLCDANLGDDRCKVDFDTIGAGYKRVGTVSTVFDGRSFRSTSAQVLLADSNWFTKGQLTWTTGDNDNYIMEIRSHTKEDPSTAFFELLEAMPYPIGVGDAFLARVGCDKTIETCKMKFNNVVNFRGFPRVPGNDAILRFARQKDNNDGGSLFEDA